MSEPSFQMGMRVEQKAELHIFPVMGQVICQQTWNHHQFEPWVGVHVLDAAIALQIMWPSLPPKYGDQQETTLITDRQKLHKLFPEKG